MREPTDPLLDTAARVARARAVRTSGGGFRPLCDPEELRSVALLAIAKAALTSASDPALVATVAHRAITNHLRTHGPAKRSKKRRTVVRSLDAPVHAAAAGTLLDRLAAPEETSDAEPARPTLIVLDTDGRGTLYRCPETGGEVRTKAPYGAVRRAFDAHTAPPYLSTREAAEAAGQPFDRVRYVLRALGVVRPQSAAVAVWWQRRKGEDPEPAADPRRETLRLGAHVDRLEDVGRVRDRHPSILWAHRAAKARETRRFRPVGDLSALSERDRAVVRAVASGRTLRSVSREYGMHESNVARIVRPHKPASHRDLRSRRSPQP